VGPRGEWRLRNSRYGLTLNAFKNLVPNPITEDTAGDTVAPDPLAALEKTTVAQNHLSTVQIPRLESLRSVSQHYNSDPYALSLKVRKRFRHDKKIEAQKKKEDDQIRGRYGLPETLPLLVDDATAIEDAKKMWKEGREQARRSDPLKRRRLGSAHATDPQPLDQKASLQARLVENTARRLNSSNAPRPKPNALGVGVMFKR